MNIPDRQWLGYKDTTTDWVEADGNPGLHADWPYYPAPPGGLNALLDLCQYPQGTTFLAVDDIDQVLLLLAEQYRANRDDYHDDNLYAAGWHEDLKHLQQDGLVAGLEWGTFDEWKYSKWQSLVEDLPPGTEIFAGRPDGTRIPVPAPTLPDPEEDDDFDFDADSYKIWPLLREGANRLTVTAAGWATLEEHLRDALTLHPDLRRVSTLLKLGFNDTAVREAATTLESMLRKRLRTSRFGRELVVLVTSLMEQTGLDEDHRRIVTTRLRTIFKFVRNEFAHNVHPDLPLAEANAMCWRIATLYDNPLWEQLEVGHFNLDD